MVVTKATIANRFLLEAKAFESAVGKGLKGRIVKVGKKVNAKRVQVGLDGDDLVRDRKSIYFFR